MSNRKLASVQAIEALDPIPGADKIEVATILGWKCVVAKADGFKVGDKVVYIEVDSVLPVAQWSAFMAPRHYRVKTIKLRGQVSQGLVFPLSILFDYVTADTMVKARAGDDLTAVLGVTKHDPEAERERAEVFQKRRSGTLRWLLRFRWIRALAGVQRARRGAWPEWIEKTDEVRLQSNPRLFDRLACAPPPADAREYPDMGRGVYATEKLDGQSATYFMRRRCRRFFADRFEFGVCSRNLCRPHRDGSTYWRMEERYAVEKVMRLYMDKHSLTTLVLQGEIVGPGVQGNRYKLPALDLYLFNAVLNGRKLNPSETLLVANDCHMKSVPCWALLYVCQGDTDRPIDRMVEYAIGSSLITPSVSREGIVVRDRRMTVSFKVLNPEYLLKYGEGE